MPDPPARERNVAVLMDFENAKDANLQRVLQTATGSGQVIIRRAYADWARHAHAQNALREAGFEAVHQFTTGSGSKNSTDINLTVDAMDMLWSRPVDVFVLVTADSDFAKLAMRLREGGKQVVGIGAKGRVGRALVQACDQYIYYDEGTKPRTRRGGGGGGGGGRKAAAAPATEEDATVGRFHRVVLSAMDAAADEDGEVYGSPLHRSIKRLHPDFSYRDAGHGTFRAFVESLKPVIVTETDPKRSDFRVWVAEGYEDAAGAALEAPAAAPTSSGITLSEDVQERIERAWDRLAERRGRLTALKAGAVVAEEYGVETLEDSPLHDLDALLAAAPRLARRWRREKAALVRS